MIFNMSLKANSLMLGFVALLGGCVSPYANQNSNLLIPVTTASKEPIFLGWDSNGYKKNNTSSIINNNPSLKAAVILNEDTIICETDMPLLTTGNIFINAQGDKAKQGSVLINYVTNQLANDKNYAFQMRLLSIQTESALNEANYKNDIKKSEGEINKLTDFTQKCTVNKLPKAVNIVEKKPISKLVKIKAKLDSGYYELWTYDFSLTIN